MTKPRFLRGSTLILLLFLGFLCWLAEAQTLARRTPEQILKLAHKDSLLVILVGSTHQGHKEMSDRIEMEVFRVEQQCQAGALDVTFGFLDATTATKSFNELSITEVPAIMIYRGGYGRQYIGQRVGPVLFGFLYQLLTEPPVVELVSKTVKKQFSFSDKVRVIGYFESITSPDYLAFDVAAKLFQGILEFGYTTDKKTAAKNFKLKELGQITMLKPSEKTLYYGGTRGDKDQLIKWIEANRIPLWDELTFHNVHSTWLRSTPSVVLFKDDGNKGATDKAFAAFKTLAKKHFENKDDLKFLLINADQYPDFLKSVGLESKDLPTFGIFRPAVSEEYFFPKDQKISLSTVSSWISSFLAGKLKPNTLYSSNDNVYQLTSQEWDRVVTNPGKDIFIQFHSPWCTTCKDLAPEYKKLAAQYSDVHTVLIASMDVPREQPPPTIEIKSFPHFLFFPADDKDNPIEYTGDLSFEAMNDFIMQSTKLSPDTGHKEEL